METQPRARLRLWQSQPRETELKTGSREEPCPEARAASLGTATDWGERLPARHLGTHVSTGSWALPHSGLMMPEPYHYLGGLWEL